MVGAICLALLATSCRRLPFAPPTSQPTITPTPRSTELPPVPTALPVGSAENPVHIKFVALPAAGDQAPSSSAVSDLEKALLDQTQMTVDVEIVNNDAEALAALCASPGGTVTSAWLSGLAYAAAYAQDCGSAQAQVKRGTGSSASTGDQASIVVNSALGLSAVGDLAKHSFCRLGYNDLYSWLIPSLMLRSGGLSLSDLSAINDYDDARTMLDDVAAGKCDSAGIAGSQFDEVASADARAKIRTLQQSVMIPYSVLVMPQEVPLAQGAQLRDALIAIGNGSHADLLKPLLNQDQLEPVTDDDLTSVRSFITRAGVDLSQAGD